LNRLSDTITLLAGSNGTRSEPSSDLRRLSRNALPWRSRNRIAPALGSHGQVPPGRQRRARADLRRTEGCWSGCPVRAGDGFDQRLAWQSGRRSSRALRCLCFQTILQGISASSSNE
jgi:hypothetical protein